MARLIMGFFVGKCLQNHVKIIKLLYKLCLRCILFFIFLETNEEGVSKNAHKTNIMTRE